LFVARGSEVFNFGIIKNTPSVVLRVSLGEQTNGYSRLNKHLLMLKALHIPCYISQKEPTDLRPLSKFLNTVLNRSRKNYFPLQ
jgi:hypothetical protein